MLMHMIEQSFIFPSALFSEHCTVWYRFIDDAFAVWTGDSNSLSLFNFYLNSLIPGLKFNIMYNNIAVPFLDTLLSIKDGHIVSDLYRKPTDRNQLLFSSFHPPGVFKSIPRSQLKRVTRITSEVDTCNMRLDEMEGRLRQWGYPADSVHSERINIHNKTISVSNQGRRMPFTSQFHPFSHKINIIKKHWSMLRSAHPSVPEFNNPPLPSYRRGRTIRDRLVKSDQFSIPNPRATFLGPKNTGSFPCLSCIQCSSMIKGKSFSHTLKGYEITTPASHPSWCIS